MKQPKTPLLRNKCRAVSAGIAALHSLGTAGGLSGAADYQPRAVRGEAIRTIVENFLTYSKPQTQLKYLGNTLVKTAPLLMCSLSVLFAYKVGLFNIGAAGQYVVGAGACLYCALAWRTALVCVPPGRHCGRSICWGPSPVR